MRKSYLHSTYETNSMVVSPALRINHPIPTLLHSVMTSLHPLSGIVPMRKSYRQCNRFGTHIQNHGRLISYTIFTFFPSLNRINI
jgi:hypothetical protein